MLSYFEVTYLWLRNDEETGEQAYKKVVRLFRNETKEWYNIYVNGEKIECTGGHPFYVASADKFIPARELKIGQTLLLSNGECVIIEDVKVKKLTKPETTYNFEVEDYHTYYVTESKVLVHNTCGTERVGRWMSEKEYQKMLETGYVQEGGGGVTYVSRPADMTAYMRQAAPGSLYVEFDVPISSLRNTQVGWAKIIGPNSIDARLMIKQGLNPPLSMPEAFNIKLIAIK